MRLAGKDLNRPLPQTSDGTPPPDTPRRPALPKGVGGGIGRRMR
jgi:hypothetical protein